MRRTLVQGMVAMNIDTLQLINDADKEELM